MKKLIEFKDIIGSYHDEGEGDVLILVHGYCGDHSVWEPVMSTLSRLFRVIRPDLPGFGGSSLTKDNLTVEWMADWIHEIFRVENLKDAVLLGHSMGGYVSLAFTAKHPHLLAGLGLIHSHSFADSDEKKSKRKRALKFLHNNESDGFVKELYKTLFTPEFIASNINTIEALIAHAMQYSKQSLIAGYEAMLKRSDHSETLRKFRSPVLFFSGKKDQSIDFELSLKQASLPAISDIHFLEDIGHMGMYEATNRLKEVIVEFMALTVLQQKKVESQ